MSNVASPMPLARRSFLALGSGTLLGLAGCAKGTTASVGSAPTGSLPSGAPPPRTELSISIHSTELQLKASGKLADLPFKVTHWPNFTAGPDVIQGFRARSIQLASNAGLPPIQAQAIGFDTKIVAVQLHEKPLYVFATAPGTDIRSAKDFRGKKLGFSQGQAQGAVLLRAVKEAGLSKDDVTLVPLTSNQFLTALQTGQVDVAPLAEPVLTKYVGQFGKDGARRIDTHVVDLLSVLWAPASVLENDDKLAAIKSFIPFWARGSVWAWENKEAWNQVYYVKDQGVTAQDGRRITKSVSVPVFPKSWDKAIAWEQQTADLLAENGFVPKARVDSLFDRRFESIAAQSVPAEYRR
ncbi:ABC transporter substrate-binding protein [Streptomyces sp. NPDC051320]|uniref:ABC transporter substrate-binding protein n=1 Tax=Streptomyces sp. NPDC051320 TaxID=3154644 RepID=UPI003425357A